MSSDQHLEYNHISRTRLYFAVFSVSFLYICNGTIGAWTSPTMPKLKNTFTADEIALVGSLYSLGAAFGPIIAAFSLDNQGRKITLYIWGVCFIISWIILASSINIYFLYIGRIIGGIGVGGVFSTGSLFIAEVADVKIRGSIGSVLFLPVAIGSLIEFCVGPWTSYLILILVSVIPAILFFITFFFIPESPYYLLLKHNKTEAIESLRWYRGNLTESSVQEEITEIQDSINKSKANKGGFKALLRRGPFRALMIAVYLLILQQGCGHNAMFSYAENIFEMSHIGISGSNCAIIGGVTVAIAGILTPFIVHAFSMKRTYIVSTYLVGISLGLLAAFFFLQSSGNDVSKLSILPILSYIMYNIFNSWGNGPLPWAMAAELFPIEVKSLASSICGVVSSLTGFIVIEITGIMLSRVGPAIVFAGYFVFVLVVITLSIFIVPQTKGMSLPEIHEFMATGKRPEKRRVQRESYVRQTRLEQEFQGCLPWCLQFLNFN